MIKQLELDGFKPLQTEAPSWAHDDYLGAAMRAGIPLEWLGVCLHCPLLEVCGEDECGRLGFSTAVNDPKKYGYGYRF